MPATTWNETFVEEAVLEVEQAPEESQEPESLSWTTNSHPADRDTNTNHLQITRITLITLK